MATAHPAGRGLLLSLVFAAGCGQVTKRSADAGPVGSDDAAVDAPGDAVDLRPHVVFVTSTVISGAMPPRGGLAGADAMCTERAAAAGLRSTFLAWLATAPNNTPAVRMIHHKGPYQLTTGVIIAQGWDDLTDGNLANKIDRTETGSMSQGTFVCRGGEVWSNVDGAGNLRVNQGNCVDWTNTGATGTAGNVTNMDVMWTAGDCLMIGCSSGLPIYCVEQ